ADPGKKQRDSRPKASAQEFADTIWFDHRRRPPLSAREFSLHHSGTWGRLHLRAQRESNRNFGARPNQTAGTFFFPLNTIRVGRRSMVDWQDVAYSESPLPRSIRVYADVGN
ncbi:hypothetical protein N8642_02445, partial [bacterium]|nr:hypothetical protein [bacterium]